MACLTKESFNISKASFLENHVTQLKKLGAEQREYKKILAKKLVSTKYDIEENGYKFANSKLLSEKEDLRAQIWVAQGPVHTRQDEENLCEIQCHVQCQEILAEDIRGLKVTIRNMEREVNRVTKQIYELNRKIVPEKQHLDFVARTRKKLQILENSLEKGIGRECDFTTTSNLLRENLRKELNLRNFFNESYGKLVQTLNNDKKYMLEITEYALNVFDNCIDEYDKIDTLVKREKKEIKYHRIQIVAATEKQTTEADNKTFVQTKQKDRPLADLQPKEYRRREAFVTKHIKKLGLYNRILDKITEYTETEEFDKVIKNYQAQESLYYSYFNFENELAYKMTLLNNSLNRLFNDININKMGGLNAMRNQLQAIDDLETVLEEKRRNNEELRTKRQAYDTRLRNLLKAVENIFDICKLNRKSFKRYLGKHNHINLINIRRFTKLIEETLINAVTCVYISERQLRSSQPIRTADLIVTDIEKICDPPTKLMEIVKTQECAECAESEAAILDAEADTITMPHTTKETQQILYESVNAPEMQYRLHTLSSCRLPRSRALVAKRNM